MGALQNFIIVVPGSLETVRRVLIALQPLIVEHLGSLCTLSVQDFVTGSIDDQMMVGRASDALPHWSDHETVALYPSEPRRGTVLISHEGPYDLVVLSLGKHTPTLDVLTRIWSAVGADAHAVLAGEELDVNENQVGALLEEGEIPDDLDLCQAAVAKLPLSFSRASELGGLVEHGGRLLLKGSLKG